MSVSADNTQEATPLRPAGHNERRYITRQSLGFYRTLAVGGVYTCNLPVKCTQETFFPALKHCITTHPLLSAAIAGQDSEAPEFVRPKTIDLRNHIEIVHPGDFGNNVAALSEEQLIKYVVLRTMDIPLSSVESIPPWKVVAFALPSQNDTFARRLLILWAFYHSHGDGRSALAFNKTFLEGLNMAGEGSEAVNDPICQTPITPLLPNIEQAGKLSISWNYLLGPLLGAYLPTVVTKALGLRASTTPKAEDQWKGRKVPFNPETFETGLEVFRVNDTTMQAVLQKCRQHNTKFTGLLHQLIVRALTQLLPADAPAGSFVGLSVVDLRRLLNGIGPDDISSGVGPTACFELFPRSKSEDWNGWSEPDSTSPVWTAARKTTQSLAECANTLHDQPIGLLSYLSELRPWMKSEAEKDRDSSYEVSNVGVFDPAAVSQRVAWDIESMWFAQPANVVGSCLAFNAVTRKGGDMIITLTWQKGTLGVEDEQAFGSQVCGLVEKSLKELA